jgi:hypothetical protein
MDKILNVTDIEQAKTQISDLKTFGNGNLFKLLSKASSKSGGWMKSTKAMQIDDVGCVVQVTTQQGDNIAEALCFVPGVRILTDTVNYWLAPIELKPAVNAYGGNLGSKGGHFEAL